MLRRLASILTLLTALAVWPGAAIPAAAQNNAQSVEEPYKFDIGLAMGMSGYWGDLSNNMFQNPGIAATALFHYRFDTRWLIRASLTGASMSGSNKKATNVLPGGMYEFEGGFYALDARAEFNFFSFGIGETYKRLKRWSPYLALGLGLSMSSVNSSTHVAMTVPMAVGARYKVSERVNLGAEWTFMKVFGDKVDGYSDLTGVSTDFLRATDWVSALQIYFTYEFGRRCTACNRHD